MSSPVAVTGKATDSTGAGIPAVILIQLSWDCWLTDNSAEVVQSTRILVQAAADGTWTTNLWRNIDLSPVGSSYTVKQGINGNWDAPISIVVTGAGTVASFITASPALPAQFVTGPTGATGPPGSGMQVQVNGGAALPQEVHANFIPGSGSITIGAADNPGSTRTDITIGLGTVAESQITNLTSDLALKAPLASPALTGTPTAPTAAPSTNTTQLASTAYADAAVAVENSRATTAEATKATSASVTAETTRATNAEALLAPLASPALTGNPTAPTQTALNNSMRLASTAYADTAVGVETTRATTAEALKAPLASPTFTGTVTVPTTVNATDPAQKAYVDGVAQGLSPKASVKALSASNVALSGLLVVDGYQTVDADRVLLTAQSTASQNGIWLAHSGAWTRPLDFATGANAAGTFVFVEGGTVYAGGGWVEAQTATITVDTTAQVWTQFSGAGEITAGTSLTKSGNTLALGVVAESQITNLTSDLALKAPLASPALTGTPTAPTAAALTNTTQLASTAYADAAVSVENTRATTAEALKAPLASPTFTGTVTAPIVTSATSITGPIIDKGGAVYHIKAYGAKVDGTTDDTAAVLAAFAAAPAGSTIMFPQGNTRIATVASGVALLLLNTADITLMGYGNGSILTFDGITAVDALRLDGCKRPTIRGLSIRFANGAKVTNGIQYTCAPGGSVHDSLFDNVEVLGGGGGAASRFVYDTFVVAASTVVTSAQAAFAAGDVGSSIMVDAALDITTDVIQSVATLTQTATAVAITAGQTTIPMLGAIASAPTGQYTVKIDSEVMLVTGGGQTATLTVTRGYSQTTAATHLASATVTTYQATLLAAPANSWGPAAMVIQATPGNTTVLNGFAVATDHPGSATLDVAGTTFVACTASNVLGAGLRFGNGTTGNILNTGLYGCDSNSNGVGVLGAQTGFSWHGPSCGDNGIDFKIAGGAANEPYSIMAVRSERSALFLEASSGTNAQMISMRDCISNGPSCADGVFIRSVGSAFVQLDNVVAWPRTAPATQALTIAVGSQNASFPAHYVGLNVSSAGSINPIPPASTFIMRWASGGCLIASGSPVLSSDFAPVSDVGGSGNIQVFAGSSGTWTKPVGAQTVSVTCIGAGGSGGSGASVVSTGSGGGGGGSGGYSSHVYAAATLGATESVTVGAGGASVAGVGGPANGTAGNAGSANSSFGTHMKANLGGGGGAGTSAGAGTAGTAGTGITTGSAGGAGVNGAAGTGGGTASTYGGGGGGGATSSTAFAGAAGGGFGILGGFAGGTAGTLGGGAGGNGTSATVNEATAGSAGGGGGGATGGVTAGGAGGSGGNYGAGGGGGGCSISTATSGASGKGGDGIVVVITT